ncbi:MAG TPA: transposase [Hyphomicrobiales bacterium]|nr:transposase [Hyphomicrobiales bacterium]
MILNYKYRIKDATTAKHLARHARACNFVWNYCCEIQRSAERRRKGGMNVRWPSGYDLIKLCTGSGALLGLHSDTVQTVCRQFAAARDAKRKCPRFRASIGPKRALGWLPFIPRAVQIDGSQVTYLKRRFWFWRSRDIPLDGFKSGCFTQDARGRWYVVFQCEVADNLPAGTGEIGIDLGLKTLATCSDGSIVPALRHYRKYQAALAIQQRAGNKRRVRAIHAKIANARKHQIHEATTRIARGNALIVVGNVNAAQLAKTRMAKSVFDASWSMFRNQLRYKASRHGAAYVDANERWTSQTCSRCGEIPDSSPKGMGALGIRHWNCSGCGASHDRDVNAARNILRVGQERLAPVEEIAVRKGDEGVKEDHYQRSMA